MHHTGNEDSVDLYSCYVNGIEQTLKLKEGDFQDPKPNEIQSHWKSILFRKPIIDSKWVSMKNDTLNKLISDSDVFSAIEFDFSFIECTKFCACYESMWKLQ